jgi:F0F1-type ATP synthase alpha subunit
VPVEQQIVQLLAGVEGLLDDLENRHVVVFINAVTDHFVANEAALLQEILDQGSLKKDNLRDRLKDAIAQFKTTWAPA